MTKSARIPLISTADALRHEGYVPLPRLWVKQEDIPNIHAIAHPHAEQIQHLRNKVSAINSALVKSARDLTLPDPLTSKEAAWAAHEKAKKDAS